MLSKAPERGFTVTFSLPVLTLVYRHYTGTEDVRS